MKVLTILIPVLNEEINLPILYSRLVKVIDSLKERIRAEVIILDNCSDDNTPAIAKEICQKDPNWKFVRYSRNFGYHGSLAGGFDLSTGDALIVLAGDLQEPPELIPRMIDSWEKGYDVVYGVLEERNDSNFIKTLGAKIFYQLIYFISDSKLPISATDFRLISRRVINAVNAMREPDRYLRGLVHWVGFKQIPFKYSRDKRIHGKSTAGIWYSTKWAFNAMMCFSHLPLRAMAFFGLFTMIGTALASIYFIFVRFFPPVWMPVPPTGTTAIILILLFAIGINSIFLGIMGEYVGRIYNQGKERPLYIVDEKVNFE